VDLGALLGGGDGGHHAGQPATDYGDVCHANASLVVCATPSRAREPSGGSRLLQGVELQELVHAAQWGEPLTMAARLRTLAPYVGRICGAIALQDGDDAMQETMIQVLQHLRSLREPAALHGWVRRIAVREALKLAQARCAT
jgi:hypothetical protein